MLDSFTENKEEIAATQRVVDELNAKLERKHLEFTVIQTLSNEIATTLDLERIFSVTMQNLDRSFGFKHALILLKEHDADALKVAASHGYANTGSGASVPFGQGVIGVVAKRRKLMRSVGLQYKMAYARTVGAQLNQTGTEVTLPGLPDVKSQLAIPLLAKDELIGVLAVESNDANAFAALDEMILGIVGNQIGAALANARAYKEIEALTTHLEERVADRTRVAEEARCEADQQRNEIAKINELTRQINENLDLDKILDGISEYFNSTFGIRHYMLWRRKPGENKLYPYRGTFVASVTEETQLKLKDMLISLDEMGGMHATACRAGRAVYFRGMHKRKSHSTIENTLQGLLQFESLLVVPLMANGEIIGTMDLSHYQESMLLTKRQIDSISAFCNQISGIINNAQLLKKTEEAKSLAVAERAIAELARSETEQARQETQSLNQLIKKLNENLDLKVITDKLHSYVRETYAIEYFALYGMDTLGENLTVMHVSFPEYTEKADRAKFMNFRIPIKNVRGAHAFTIRAKRPWYLKKIKKEGITPEELFAIERLRMESFLMIPLILQGEPVGILDFWNDGQLSLTKDEISRLSILGEQLAGIIYGSKLFQQVHSEKARSDELLLNILPAPIAEELKATHQVVPQYFESVSVLFTDFVGFTKVSEKMSPAELVQELDGCFSQFDEVVRRNSMEKLKTIGDAYMCAAGIPERNPNHAVDACLTALEFCAFMTQMAEIKGAMKLDFWKIRIGVHSGPVTAGVIGTNKFAYDIWGDTVNTASRMESSGTPGKVNISAAVYELVKDFFDCESRGEIEAKGKGKVGMYYLLRIKPGLSADDEGRIPNRKFIELRAAV